MNIVSFFKNQNISDLAKEAKISRSSIHRFISGSNDLGFNKIEKIINSQKKTFVGEVTPIDSTLHISQQMLEGVDWRIALFNFVDSFRRTKDLEMVKYPPLYDLELKYKSLIASTVCQLCHEMNLDIPAWAKSRDYVLKEPWFVSGVENLKAMAIVQSPIYYKKNLIFVLDNFLSRA